MGVRPILSSENVGGQVLVFGNRVSGRVEHRNSKFGARLAILGAALYAAKLGNEEGARTTFLN